MRNKIKICAAALAALLIVTPQAKAAAKVKTNPQARRLTAEGLDELERGEYSAAISSLNKAARAQGSASIYFLLGWAHYQRGFKSGSVETADRDDAQSSIDDYNVALSMDPKLSSVTDPSKLYFSLALCEEAVGSYSKALEAYQSALRAAPDKALIPLHAARLRLKMKEMDKAASNLALALSKAQKSGREDALIAEVKRDPSFAPLLSNREMRRMLGLPQSRREAVTSNFDVRNEPMRDAVSDAPHPASVAAQDPAVLDKIASGDLEFQFRRYQNAITAYDEALTIDTRRTLPAAQIASLHEKIGTSYNKIGSTDQAIFALRKSLQQNPQNAGAHYQIALAYAMAGQTAESLKALKDSFASASDPAELRRLVLLSKTDVELEAVRDLPAFSQVLADFAERLSQR